MSNKRIFKPAFVFTFLSAFLLAANNFALCDIVIPAGQSETFSGNFDNQSDASGGVFYNNGNLTTNGEFSQNSASLSGGTIYNNSGAVLSVLANTIFSGNFAGKYGGAIYSIGDAAIISASFSGNRILSPDSGQSFGAAIYNGGNMATGTVVFDNNTINTANSFGGAIYNFGSLTLGNNSVFTNNSAGRGGALYNYDDGTAAIGSNVTFGNNTATYGYGGAIHARSGIQIGDNANFSNNMSANAGGAIYIALTGNQVSNDFSIGSNAVFSGNTASDAVSSWAYGGAIAIDADNTVDVTIGGNAVFSNNTAAYGGAIANLSTNALNLGQNTTFDGNSAATAGGAIFAASDLEITNTNFTNNSAGLAGGAIYAGGNLSITADGADVIFDGNSAADGSDIYMAAPGSTVEFYAYGDNKIVLNGGISGAGAYNIVLNDPGPTGTIVINAPVSNAALSLDGGTLQLTNNDYVNGQNTTIDLTAGTLDIANGLSQGFDPNVVTVSADSSINVNIDVATGTGNNLSNVTFENGATLAVAQVSPVGSTTANYISIDLAQALGLDPSNLAMNSVQTDTLLTPVRYLGGAINNGILSYAPTGNSYKDFNPAIMAAPVAAQMAGYLSQLTSYDQAFMNMDMKMLLTREERQALKLQNKYASADETAPMVFSPAFLPEKEKGAWVRPYAAIERVHLKGGPRVANVGFGSFFGADSDMYEFENGFEGQCTLYAGYNGSHQTFDGVGLYQNGGNLGVTGLLYKNDFFAALTANAGANGIDASTMYGYENFSMLMAGAALKTGYNWELFNGKLIIQPSYLMSYTFVKAFDYTNAASVSITSEPLNVIQISPGIKLIGNLEGGWQPYLAVNMIWNIMDTTRFKAAETSLPQLSVRPYVEYGIGIQRRWGGRFTGFAQAMLRNGGRDSIAATMGLRIALGKDKKP
ncbi:MAG: hypothetical protein LBK53_06775 [Heliobacteriaceae bacterium]|nr:hypothetical protein [Heliobacteriaceae bacterium]